MPELHRRSQPAVAGVNEKLTLVNTPSGPVLPLTSEILFSLVLSRLWPAGWRLYILQSYEVNGEVLYNAGWRSGHTGEIQVYSWTYAEYPLRLILSAP